MQRHEHRDLIGTSQELVKAETVSAKVLLYVTLAALFLSNSHWHSYYEIFFHNPHFLLLVDMSIATLQIPIVLGILLGLFLGKQIGVFSACWLAVKLRLAKLPDHVIWPQLYGVIILCGIGFTISLFIGTLAFSNNDPAYLSAVKIGVLGGSILSGSFGYFLLRRFSTVKL